MRRQIREIFVFIICLYAAGPLHASDQANHSFGPWYLSESQPGWYFDGIVGIEREPSYAGSDDYEVEPDLSARAIYKSQPGHRYFVTLGEFGAVFEFSPDLLAIAFLEYEEGREVAEDDVLTGLDEIEATVEGQFSLGRRFGDFSIAGVLQPDILGRGKGLVTFIAGAYDKTLIPQKLHFNAGIDLSWGDSEYMQTEFGISESAAVNSNLAAYNAGAGFKSATMGLGLEYWLTNKISFIAVSEIEIYGSEAADSPLLDQEGSDTTFEVAIGARYNF